MRLKTRIKKIFRTKIKLDPIGLGLGILSVSLGLASLARPVTMTLFPTDSIAVYGKDDPTVNLMIAFVLFSIAIAAFAYAFFKRRRR